MEIDIFKDILVPVIGGLGSVPGARNSESGSV